LRGGRTSTVVFGRGKCDAGPVENTAEEHTYTKKRENRKYRIAITLEKKRAVNFAYVAGPGRHGGFDFSSQFLHLFQGSRRHVSFNDINGEIALGGSHGSVRGLIQNLWFTWCYGLCPETITSNPLFSGWNVFEDPAQKREAHFQQKSTTGVPGKTHHQNFLK
jgi:hypothetical protein